MTKVHVLGRPSCVHRVVLPYCLAKIGSHSKRVDATCAAFFEAAVLSLTPFVSIACFDYVHRVQKTIASQLGLANYTSDTKINCVVNKVFFLTLVKFSRLVLIFVCYFLNETVFMPDLYRTPHQRMSHPLSFLLHGNSKALESLEPVELREARRTMFGQCLVDLVGVLLSLMRYPEDVDQLPEDEVDDLKRHRYDVADALRDVMRIIGGVSCLRQVLSILKQEVRFDQYCRSDWVGPL